jgi:hypothetical protein
MLQLFNYPKLLFSPDAPSGTGGATNTGGASGEMSKADIIDFLAEDDKPDVIDLQEGKDKDKDKDKGKEKEEEIPDEGETEEEETEEEIDELDEIEQELEPPTEEQLELVTPVRRKEILKKYPDVFKDFPYLEKAYYREQQFTELLPTIADAKAAVEKSEILDRFEGDLMSGSTETVLQAVKATNPNGFYKIVDDYLPTLAKVDEKAYYHVIGNLTKHTIVSMVQEARRLGVQMDAEGKPQPGVALQNAALLLNQFVFGTTDFKPPTQLSNQEKPEDNTRERQLAEREQNYVRTQFENTRVDLNTRVNNTLKNTIDAHIDPKKSMTDYVRKNAARDTMDSLERVINQDTRFKALLDKLWEKAFADGFSKESTDRIRSAYVSKAKTVLPALLKKARNEALRGTGHRVREDNDSSDTKRGPVPSGRPRSQERQSGKTGKEAKEVPKGMSTLEFLNSD